MSEQQNQSAASNEQPKIQQLDMQTMLMLLLKSQEESASLQRRLLERELAKDEAAAAKDEIAKAKIERDRQQLLGQMKIQQVNKAKRIAGCPHTDQKGGSTIYPISNWPDRQLRGICTNCPIFIEPEHVEVDGSGRPTLIAQHPLYHLVQQRDRALYSEFVPLTGY